MLGDAETGAFLRRAFRAASERMLAGQSHALIQERVRVALARQFSNEERQLLGRAASSTTRTGSWRTRAMQCIDVPTTPSSCRCWKPPTRRPMRPRMRLPDGLRTSDRQGAGADEGDMLALDGNTAAVHAGRLNVVTERPVAALAVIAKWPAQARVERV